MALARSGFGDMKRLFISIIAATVISFIIFLTLNDFGITWDEPIYMRNGDAYVSWLKQPIPSDVDKFFRATTDDMHPPFRKFIAGITHEVLTTNLRIIDNTRGYRISSLLFVFPLTLALAYIAIGHYGYVIGLLVPFLFSFLPHVLYLTGLLTLDYAVTALWFLAVMAGLKGLKNNLWLTVSGISIGLAMLTKFHGFLLFIPIVGYLAWQKSGIWRIIYLIIVAFLIYVAGWPWLWTSPLAHIEEYFRLQAVHGGIPVFVLGNTYQFAPWWYTSLMFLVTTPALILVLFIIGAFWTVRHGKTWDKVMLVNALYPLALFSLPGVYRYDWVRLFLPAFPFVVLVAARAITRKRLFFIVILWAVTLITSVIRIHPWESAYYNELVGGISGAQKLGFETEFWGNSYLGVLPWMNANKSHPMCVTPTTNQMYYYQAMGQLAPDVVFSAPVGVCEYAIVLMRQGLFIKDPFIASVASSQKPMHTVSVDGVPLVAVYDITNIKE